MRKIKVKAGQTLNDIALQELGSTDGMLAIARLNSLGGIDANLSEGQELVIDDTELLDRDTRDYIRDVGTVDNLFVATAEDEGSEIDIDGHGIGYDLIGIDNDIA